MQILERAYVVATTSGSHGDSLGGRSPPLPSYHSEGYSSRINTTRWAIMLLLSGRMCCVYTPAPLDRRCAAPRGPRHPYERVPVYSFLQKKRVRTKQSRAAGPRRGGGLRGVCLDRASARDCTISPQIATVGVDLIYRLAFILLSDYATSLMYQLTKKKHRSSCMCTSRILLPNAPPHIPSCSRAQ